MESIVSAVTANLSDRIFDENRMDAFVSHYLEEHHLEQTQKALAFAKEKHKGQYRKKGHTKDRVPYIYHPLLLTCHAIALGMDEEDMLSACLLHDVVEDCGVLPEELPVSEACRRSVVLLTKPGDFDHSEPAMKAYIDGICTDRVASVVKLLDRCNNVSGMANSFTDERMAAYILETQGHIHDIMEHCRHAYPEYTNQLFLIRYHMYSVMEALKHHMLTNHPELVKVK